MTSSALRQLARRAAPQFAALRGGNAPAHGAKSSFNLSYDFSIFISSISILTSVFVRLYSFVECNFLEFLFMIASTCLFLCDIRFLRVSIVCALVRALIKCSAGSASHDDHHDDHGHHSYYPSPVCCLYFLLVPLIELLLMTILALCFLPYFHCIIFLNLDFPLSMLPPNFACSN